MTMKANELRIGNLIIQDDEIRTVICRTLEWLSQPEYITHYNDIKPIPLTEEWLIKFGFEKFPHVEQGYKIKISKGVKLYSRLFQGRRILNIEYGRMVGQKVKLPDCEYVHTLQNLYFALTGEELTWDS